MKSKRPKDMMLHGKEGRGQEKHLLYRHNINHNFFFGTNVMKACLKKGRNKKKIQQSLIYTKHKEKTCFQTPVLF